MSSNTLTQPLDGKMVDLDVNKDTVRRLSTNGVNLVETRNCLVGLRVGFGRTPIRYRVKSAQKVHYETKVTDAMQTKYLL